MPTTEGGCLARTMRATALAALLAFAIGAAAAQARTTPQGPYFARVNTFGVFISYSGDSSHMLLGDAPNRRLLNVGASYSRRILVNRIVNWQYNGELAPVALESDPVEITTTTLTWTNPTETITDTVTIPTMGVCQPTSGSGTYANGGPAYVYSSTCGRRWTVGEAMSPVGFEWNFMPRRKLQPLIIGHGGYMYSSQQIPVDGAGSFNFTFDVGAGFELFRSPTRSIRAEYRYHHISNDNTAEFNPGIDSGLFQITYSFGR